MKCPEKRMKQSLATLETFDLDFKKKKTLNRSPRGALSDIMSVIFSQGSSQMRRVNYNTNQVRLVTKKTKKETPKVDLAGAFMKLFEQDKENLNVDI